MAGSGSNRLKSLNISKYPSDFCSPLSCRTWRRWGMRQPKKRPGFWAFRFVRLLTGEHRPTAQGTASPVLSGVCHLVWEFNGEIIRRHKAYGRGHRVMEKAYGMLGISWQLNLPGKSPISVNPNIRRLPHAIPIQHLPEAICHMPKLAFKRPSKTKKTQGFYPLGLATTIINKLWLC